MVKPILPMAFMLVKYGVHAITNVRSMSIGQIDCRETRTFFGVELEGQGLSQVMWTNGVRSLLFTGYESGIGLRIASLGLRAQSRSASQMDLC